MAAKTAEKNQVEVELPTVGRLVHFRIDVGTDEVLRPALVLGQGKDAGFLLLQVFLLPTDLPFPYGSRIYTRDGVAGFFAAAPFGPECGEWRWPQIGETPDMFVVPE